MDHSKTLLVQFSDADFIRNPKFCPDYEYSILHTKAGHGSAFEFILMPVPTIWLPDHLKPRPKKCLRDGHSKAGRSGFRMYTVLSTVNIQNLVKQFLSIKLWQYGFYFLKTRFSTKLNLNHHKWFFVEWLAGTGSAGSFIDTNTNYSQHPKSGLSSFWMVIFWTQFVSGLRMVGHLFLTAISF
jgi:hypothetical protein